MVIEGALMVEEVNAHFKDGLIKQGLDCSNCRPVN